MLPPPGSNGFVCLDHTATAVMPGFGPVSLAFTVTQDYRACAYVAVTGGTLATRDTGSLQFAGAKPACAGSPSDSFLKGEVPVTITGGDGDLAGASGQGTLTLLSYGSSNRASGELSLALDAPNGRFDLTPPTLSGATSKTVRARKGAKRVRVTYQVRAQDAVDGPVPLDCKPRSGSWFKVGRTRVTCSATDSSANTATVGFTVLVRRS